MDLQKTSIAMAIAMLSCSATQAGLVSQAITISGTANANNNIEAFGPNTASGTSISGSSSTGYWADSAQGSAKSSASAGAEGNFAVETSGTGVFSAYSNIYSNFTFVNTALEATHYTLRLLVNAGSAYVSQSHDPGETGFRMMVSLDGADIFDQTASFKSDGSYAQDISSALMIDTVSQVLYPNGLSTIFSWEQTWLEIDLGILDAGQSINIDYGFFGYAFGDYEDISVCSAYYSYGCGASLNIGDPYRLDGVPIFINSDNPPSYVPEPGSALLTITGLLGLAALRKRRKSIKQTNMQIH